MMLPVDYTLQILPTKNDIVVLTYIIYVSLVSTTIYGCPWSFYHECVYSLELSLRLNVILICRVRKASIVYNEHCWREQHFVRLYYK